MGAENTWLETAWEDRTMPAQKRNPYYTGFLSYCSLAQSVEHAAVNRGVVSSSLTGAAKGKKPVKDRLLSFACCGTLQLAIPCFGRRTAVNWSETPAGLPDEGRQWRGKGGRARRKQGGMKPGSIPATRPTMFSTVGVVSSSLTGAAIFSRFIRCGRLFFMIQERIQAPFACKTDL